jgi:hypothetical protein
LQTSKYLDELQYILASPTLERLEQRFNAFATTAGAQQRKRQRVS